MRAPILPRARSVIAIFITAFMACGLLTLGVHAPALAQGGVDAQSRSARADSLRRAKRTAAAAKPLTPSAASAAVVPGSSAGSRVTANAGSKVATAAASRAASQAASHGKLRIGVPTKGRAAQAATSGGVPTKSTGNAPASVAVPAAVPVGDVQPTAAVPAAAPPVQQRAVEPVAPTRSAAPIAGPATPPADQPPAPRALSPRQADSVRAVWRVAEPVVWVASPLARRVSPGLGFATPSGYGPAWGDFFVSVSYQQRTRFTKLKDGAFGFGMGLGDPVGSIGGELVYSSFGSIRSGLFSNGTISARVHRIIRGYGVSVGLENLAEVGRTTSAGPDGGQSIFLAVSQLLRLGDAGAAAVEGAPSGSEVLWTVGLGNGRFRRESDVLARTTTVNVFGSLGYRFVERAAAILDVTGQDLTLALSVSPFRCVPLVLTPGVADITGSAGDGARFVLAIGMSTRFDKDAFFRRQCSP